MPEPVESDFHGKERGINDEYAPVTQLQMGWEVMWARRSITEFVDDDSNEHEKADALRIQYGVWFFF